jgi:hypothetical protein
VIVNLVPRKQLTHRLFSSPCRFVGSEEFFGRLFRVTKQLVSFRLRQLPEPVTAGMRRLVATKLAREGVVFISEQEMDGLKAIIRRERKKAHGRKPQQVA